MIAWLPRLAALVLASAGARGDAPAPAVAPLPPRLGEAGLHAEGSREEVRPGIVAYSPQYPLWSDGAAKRRWLHLPPGKAIDASRPGAWVFPEGTRFWKEFSYGRPVETRLIERLADGTWRYATYVWNEAGTDATLAPREGIAALPVEGAPDGRHAIPSEADCRACHEGAAVPVLGVSALQLSPDRDPLAPHREPRRAGELDLRGLVASGRLANFPAALLESPPRIAAASPAERAALGDQHANCGHCHGAGEAAPPVDLVLAQGAGGRESATDVLRTLVGAPGRHRLPGLPGQAPRVEPGRPEASALPARMRSRDPRHRMPPLGTRIPDAAALTLIDRWIRDLPQPRKEMQP